MDLTSNKGPRVYIKNWRHIIKKKGNPKRETMYCLPLLKSYVSKYEGEK